METKTGELEGFRRLYEFSRLLLTGNEPENLVDRLVEATRAVTRADEVILFRLEKEMPRVHAISSSKEGARLPEYSVTLVREVVVRQEPLLLIDIQQDPDFGRAESIRELNITSAMGAPLHVNGDLWGLLYAARSRLAGNFAEEHRDLMTVAAAQASLLLSRFHADQALRESEQRHRVLIDLSPSAIVVLREGRVVFCNRAAVNLWGRKGKEDLLGEEVENLFDSWRSRDLWELLEGQAPFEAVEAWAGSEEDERAGCPVEVRGGPVWIDGETGLQLILNEVSEQKAVMARRVRSDRLMAMGTMATTVGHEINNPLAYVQANLDFAVKEMEEHWSSPGQTLDDAGRAELLAGLRAAREGTERIRAVVDSIQNFSRLGEDEAGVTSVERPLESSLRVARSELGPDVVLEVDLRPTAPVAVTAPRLGQVFLNLLINAAQALSKMPEGDRRLEIRSRQFEDEVIVEIVDSGPGIEESVRQHIFDPFVTTKEDGTGLGLAISSDIVAAAGGAIEVESRGGKGCLFRVRLPASEEPTTQRITMVDKPEMAQAGRILIVEPDRALAESLQRLLKSQHEVEAVSTVGEAVELLGSHREFDVILCDLRFRGGVGLDVFQWIQDQAPEYRERLVAMTASRCTQAQLEKLSALPNPWVRKPFDLQRLRSVIGAVLESRTESRGRDGSTGER